MSVNVTKNLSLPINLPNTWEDARQYVQENLKQAADSIAQTQSGTYSTTQTQSGQTLLGVEGFRKVVEYNVALPNAGSSGAISSGITNPGTFTLINLWLSAKDPATGTAFTAMGNSLGTDALDVYMVGTNIFIRTTQNYSAFTNNFIVIEYILTA